MANDENMDVFQSITGADAESAANCLEAFEGDLDRAVSHFLDTGATTKPRHTAERSGAARVNGSVEGKKSQRDIAIDRKARAAKQRATIEARNADQRHNQGYVEEEAALQQALAASNMASGKPQFCFWLSLDHWSSLSIT